MTHFSYNLLLAAENSLQQYALIAVIIVVFYFFMIRPQYKKQKGQKQFIDSLKKGDLVVTIAGIHGKIHEIEDRIIVLEIDNKGSKLSISKEAISYEYTIRQNKKT